MGKIFIDKILLERFVNHPQKLIGVFLNDVQRMKDNNISFTLVSGLFMVYSKFLTQFEGMFSSYINIWLSTISVDKKDKRLPRNKPKRPKFGVITF
jgi:hypothetical protein